jgi:CBS domain-containing protein
MIAVALSTALVGDRTIYRAQLPNRAASPAHRVRLSFPLLSSLSVRDAMTPPVDASAGPELSPDQALDEALEHLTDAAASSAPVVEDGRVVGQLAMRDVVRTYKSTLRQSVRRVSALPPETVLFEVAVADGSTLIGRSLSELQLPPSTLVVSILRDGEVLFPRAATAIRGGDRLTVLASAGSEAAVRGYFSG